VTDRGDVRAVCGIVAQAATGQADGGLATYELVVRDALALMAHRTNTKDRTGSNFILNYKNSVQF